jgi:thiamine-phosphate pyrophosphorylase
LRLYLITGERRGVELEAALAAALGVIPPGGCAVQVRAKDLDTPALLALCRRVLAVARPRGAKVLVNDRLDVALAAGADGVHLPEAGFSVAEARRAAGRAPLLIGRSTHDAPAAASAAREGADLVVLGPIFETPSKRAFGPPLGVAALGQAADELSRHGTPCRLFALGGITDVDRAASCIAAGAHGVAAVRAVLDAPDPAAAAAALWAAATR